ncbi:MAG TPA: polymer-forming cytoskeletal protein [Thermoanaerobaculia bacterium]|jgi:hypothetical protein|nr:polymer-forming cytoskeletal protein [Thermoanaerobaculia bacterium]
MLIFERWLSERSARRSVRWALAMMVALAFHFGTAGLAQAQTAGAGPSSATATAGSLRQELENRYEILPLREGVLLRPRVERSGVRSIEVSGASIAVNGERVSDSVLRAWLGPDAGPLLRLLALPVSERRALFGFSSSGGSAPASPATPSSADVSKSADAAGATESAGETATELPAVPAPPEAPAPPEISENEADDAGRDSDSSSNVRIGTVLRFSGSAHVNADEEAEKVVVIGGPATVDGSVQRDVAAIGGDVKVNGHVGRNVLSVGGDVHLGPRAEVDGDVTSVGGTVEREPGAKVHGRINQATGIGPGIQIGGDHDFDFWPWWSPFAGAMRLMWSILALAVLGLLVAVIVVVARDPVARVEAKLVTEFWQSGLAGILSQLLFIPLLVVVCFVLAISIIGIPLLIVGLPLLALALILLGLVGFSAFALRIGRLIEHRFDRHFGSTVATALVGLFAIEVCRIMGRLLALGHGPLDVFGWFFSITGLLLTYVAWTFGFGAVILTRFGMGPRRPRGNEIPPGLEPYPLAPIAPIPPIPPSAPPPIVLPEDSTEATEPEPPKIIEPGVEPKPEEPFA